ncbi:MAG: FAD-dependent oxidoreductase [Hyphomicrobiaceae bacterium]|nr:FAD-dependent oxidoreductase [Hyphomicrobiaceae bacterium]MCC0010021.1 FAD-dependent oxidoreductase [Hyphomicrobiaceae bacterium]
MLKPEISILGAGFAALTAAQSIRKRSLEAKITIIAPRSQFEYYPSLIWVPTGLRQRKDILHSLDGFFERHDINYKQATVTGLSADGRTVETSDGSVTNDALIIATGGRFIKKMPGIEHALTICEGIDAAEAIRDRLNALKSGRIALGFGGNPNEPAAMRGGPMFELLFGIDTWLRKKGRRDDVELVFFSGSPKPGMRLGEKAVTKLLEEMGKRRIDRHLGHKPLNFSPTGIETEAGRVNADLILFMPGMTGPAWIAETGLPKSEGGFIKADKFCRVEGFAHTYVAGDAGSFPGPDWLPKQAHMADLQAKAAADNLLLGLEGKEPEKTPKPELICIVDTLDKGIMVYRDQKRSVILPGSRALHWSKRAFEKKYLKALR